MSDEIHLATSDVIAIVNALLNHNGWASTRQVQVLSGVHRDTARRVLGELARHGWVAHASDGDADRWSLGPELIAIANAWTRALVAEQQRLRALFDLAQLPPAGAVRTEGPCPS